MDSDLYRQELLAQTKAALDVILSDPPVKWSAEQLGLALERLGDLLRLDEGLAETTSRLARTSDGRFLASVAHSRHEEARQWNLPDAGPVTDSDVLEFVVTRRDETESFVVGLLRVAMARTPKIPLADIAGTNELLRALETFDSALSRIASRQVVESALGIRVALQKGRSWLDRLSEGVAERQENEKSEAFDWLQFGAPPEEATTDRYIRKGLGASYVEGWAAREKAYAEDLADTIDVLKDCDEVISLKAAVWRKRKAPVPSQIGPTLLFPGVIQQAAAADVEEEDASAVQTVELGPLPRVRAEAEVTYTKGHLTLRVYAEETLERCEVNGEAAQPDAEGCWLVQLPATPGTSTWHLLVVGESGSRFEENLEFNLT